MNNPITEGAVFRQEWIRWREPLPLSKYDYLVAYCDPSFKNSSKNDYKAIKLWGKVGTELHCLAAFVRQCSVAEMVRWFYDLHERVPENVVVEYYIEANSCRTSSSTSSRARASCADTSSPSAPTDARSPTSFSA